MSSQQTYLQLVNNAIRESGTDLDSLTSSTFSTTTDTLQVRFIAWVNQAYEELQHERDWEFMHKRASIILKPRLYVEQVTGTAEPTLGRYLIGVDTGASLVSVGTPVVVSGAWASGTAKAYVEYEDLSGSFKLNELVGLYDTNGTTSLQAGLARVKGAGQYDLSVEVTDLLNADFSKMFLQSTGGSTTQTNSSSSDAYPLDHIPYDVYFTRQWDNLNYHGRPAYVTSTADGYLALYPQPEQEYVLHLNYQAEPTSLSAYSDTVTNIPAQYQAAIFWRAVMYYADYDSKPNVYMRAAKRYRFYKKRMEVELLPIMAFRGGINY